MRLGTAVLALAVGLGVVGLASAQESGNWFTRLFTPAVEKNEPAKKIDATTDLPKTPASSLNNRAAKAKADLDRRQEVCMRLREIAIATGDDELLRKAEMLDQRAYDVYLAAKNQGGEIERAKAAADAKKGGR